MTTKNCLNRRKYINNKQSKVHELGAKEKNCSKKREKTKIKLSVLKGTKSKAIHMDKKMNNGLTLNENLDILKKLGILK